MQNITSTFHMENNCMYVDYWHAVDTCLGWDKEVIIYSFPFLSGNLKDRRWLQQTKTIGLIFAYIRK